VLFVIPSVEQYPVGQPESFAGLRPARGYDNPVRVLDKRLLARVEPR
jgi:hypothetical protein